MVEVAEIVADRVAVTVGCGLVVHVAEVVVVGVDVSVGCGDAVAVSV